MSIKAWLEGESRDLECLAEMFPYGSSDFWVGQQGGRYYLSAPDLDNRPAEVAHLKIAEKLLGKANGLARTLYPDFRPAIFRGSFSEDGKPNFAQRELTIEVRPEPSAGIAANGPEPSQSQVYDELIRRNADLDEAIGLMGGELDFGQLYKVYEIIEHAGAMEAARLSAGIPKASLRLFAQSAQPSRHARWKGQPPKNPMPVQKARTMIRRLLVAWMDSMI